MTNRIFITGAASGIGRETARLFASKGWRVAIADRNGEVAGSLATELGKGAVAVEVDVMNVDATRAAVDGFCGEDGLDAIFAAAGLLDMRSWVDTPLERQYQILDVNVKGVINSFHAAMPHLRKIPNAQAISMCSTAAVYGIPEEAVYSASKFAVRALTEALNIELDPLGIWVSDIMVGFVDTPMVRDAEHKSRGLGIVGVHVRPQDVAATVWSAVHERRIHWFVDPGDEALFQQINSQSPDEKRALIKSLTGF